MRKLRLPASIVMTKLSKRIDCRPAASIALSCCRELQAVRTHRAAHRSRRQDAPIPVVALVGYTNAGKSTLLNTMTDAGVLAEDKLFATLDPTTRKVRGVLLC
jgi:GTP-binding protein HflX